MKVRNTKVITSPNPPEDTNAIWLNNGNIMIFSNGEWKNQVSGDTNTGGGGVEYEYYSFYDVISVIPTLPEEEIDKFYNNYTGVCDVISNFNIIPITVIADINHKQLFIEVSVYYYLNVAGLSGIMPILYFKIEKQDIRIMPDLYYSESRGDIQYRGDIISDKNTFKEQFIEIMKNKYGENAIDVDFINNYMTPITKEEYESLIGQIVE